MRGLEVLVLFFGVLLVVGVVLLSVFVIMMGLIVVIVVVVVVVVLLVRLRRERAGDSGGLIGGVLGMSSSSYEETIRNSSEYDDNYNWVISWFLGRTIDLPRSLLVMMTIMIMIIIIDTWKSGTRIGDRQIWLGFYNCHL